MCAEFRPWVTIFLFALFFFGEAAVASAQKLSSEAHDKKIQTLRDEQKLQYLIDNAYALYSADYDHALKLMTEGSSIAHGHRWKDKEAYCEMFEGVCYFLKGDFDKSLPAYLRSYHLFDSLKHYKGLARLCNEMAVFYSRNKDTKTAYQYLDQSEKYSIESGDRESLGTSYAHRGSFYERDGRIKEAEDLYRKVYTIRLEQKDSVGLGYALLDLANIALREGHLDQALVRIGESTAIRKKIGDIQGVAVNLVNTGETYYSVKEYRKAISFFEQSLAAATRVGYNDLIRYDYEQLSASHVQLNDFKQAFLYQQKARAFNDSLYSIEKTKVIADLQTRFETEKKEQQIALQSAELAEHKAEIQRTYIIIGALLVTMVLIVVIFLLARSRYKKQQELLVREKEAAVREAYLLASIQSQENERKRFAQDLHDGMGQLISALRLSLLAVHRDSSLEERVTVVTKAEKILNDMHREIRGIAFNLMPQTLVQHGLAPALREMAERISMSGKVLIRISTFDVPERLQEIQEISLYRIIQEWINNIVKYSNATRIEVQLVGHELEITVMVEDNGDGFDSTVLEHSAGNGWKNMRSRINLVKGSIEIDTVPGRKGTTLIIRMPVPVLEQVPAS